MALLLIVLAVVSLAILSQIFGYDSRDTMYSKERQLAGYGMTWELTDSDRELADQMEQALQRKQVQLTKQKRDEALTPSSALFGDEPIIFGPGQTCQER